MVRRAGPVVGILREHRTLQTNARTTDRRRRAPQTNACCLHTPQIKWDETAVPFEWQGYKGEVFCRVVGDKLREANTGVPPVLLVGNPGVGFDYLRGAPAP